MQIVCPHCETSYSVAPEAIGLAGRTVRCVRCRETWHATTDDMARADALVGAVDEIGRTSDTAASSDFASDPQPTNAQFSETVPEVESPPLAHDDEHSPERGWTDAAPGGTIVHRHGPEITARPRTARKFRFASGPVKPIRINLNIAITAMAALVLGLVIWRNDVVRLMPQTAGFFKLIGLDVNLRTLAFVDVRVTAETVNGNRVFVIEGAIAGTARKPVEIPRLRFVVQDGRGADIYAWNAVVEQAVLNPGEKVAFRSRLASPPDQARGIVVRFFHRRDLASGSA